VLDVLEDVLRKPGADVNTWRPRIEHAQIFQPSDFERIGRLGSDFLPLWYTGLLPTRPLPLVIASVQPAQAYVPAPTA
jgi:hypothetical protein